MESGATVILTKVSALGQMTMPMIRLIGLWDMALLLAQVLVLPMIIPREIQKVVIKKLCEIDTQFDNEYLLRKSLMVTNPLERETELSYLHRTICVY